MLAAEIDHANKPSAADRETNRNSRRDKHLRVLLAPTPCQCSLCGEARTVTFCTEIKRTPEGTTTQLLQQVVRGDVDLALVRYPIVEATDAVLRPVESDVLVAALPSSSSLARKRRLRLADLADEPFVAYSATAAMNLRTQVVGACQAAGFTPRIVQEAVQVQTVLSLVGSGVGVALVPSLSRMQAPAGVEFRKLADGAERLQTALAVATHRHNEPAAAMRFREVMTAVGADTPGRSLR